MNKIDRTLSPWEVYLYLAIIFVAGGFVGFVAGVIK
jgi:hypothetical protein